MVHAYDLALKRLRQEDGKFEVSLGYVGRSSRKREITKKLGFPNQYEVLGSRTGTVALRRGLTPRQICVSGLKS